MYQSFVWLHLHQGGLVGGLESISSQVGPKGLPRAAKV